MQELFSVYIRVFIEFYFLLTFLSVLLCIHLPRKNKLWLRILISLCVSALAILLSTVIYTHQMYFDTLGTIGSVLAFTLSYLLTFAAVIFSTLLCFDSPKQGLIFNNLTAFAIKQISENIFVLVASAIPSIAIGTELFSVLRIVNFIPCFFLFYVFVIRKVNAKTKSEKVNVNAFIAAILSLFACILFNGILMQYMEKQGILNQLCMASQTIFFLYVIILKMGVFERNMLIDENAVMVQTWKEKEKQLKLFKENIDTVNIKYHDLKKVLSVIKAQGGYVPENLLNELESSVSVHEAYVETGNSTLDVILTQYRTKCIPGHIRFSCIADGTCLDFMSSTDLIALVSNLLENAFEAVLPLNEEERSVGFILQRTRNMVMLHSENSYTGELVYQNGNLISHKENSEYHGYGIKSIKAIVKKYGGDVSIETHNNIFKINVIFNET